VRNLALKADGERRSSKGVRVYSADDQPMARPDSHRGDRQLKTAVVVVLGFVLQDRFQKEGE
jgi:hypothetical protein